MPEDCHIIESAIHAFGQTYDGAYAQRLASDLAFFTCNFPGARRGLVCARPGRKDDNHRPTLLFISAIVSRQDWDHALQGDIARLVHTTPLWNWNGQVDLDPVDVGDTPRVAISRRRVGRVLQLISELEQATPGQSVVVGEEDFSAEDIRAVEMLLPSSARDVITTACRVLSPAMPCSLLCMARESGVVDVTCRFEASAALSPYAAFLQEAGIASGIVPTQLVLDYPSFASPLTPPENLAARGASHE